MDRGRAFLSRIYHEKKIFTLQLLLASFCDMEGTLWACSFYSLSLCVPISSSGSWEVPALPTHSPSDSWYHLQTKGRFWACPLVILSQIFLVLILFQAIQEGLQAWVNQWSCSLLVNRYNSLEKRILGKKTMQMMFFQIFLILSLIKETTVKALPVTIDKCHKYFPSK